MDVESGITKVLEVVQSLDSKLSILIEKHLLEEEKDDSDCEMTPELTSIFCPNDIQLIASVKNVNLHLEIVCIQTIL